MLRLGVDAFRNWMTSFSAVDLRCERYCRIPPFAAGTKVILDNWGHRAWPRGHPAPILLPSLFGVSEWSTAARDTVTRREIGAQLL